MDGLQVLARLERQALDQESLALRGLDRSLTEVRDRIRALDEAAAAERKAAASLAGGDALLVAYLRANRARRRGAEEHRQELERARDAQLARVLGRRLELERLELLVARRAARERAALARREQKVVDELASIRASAGE